MELSILEFSVYGFVTYATLLMLLILLVKKDFPNTAANSGIRVVFLMPGIICAGILMLSGVDVTLSTTEIMTNSTDIYTYTQIGENNSIISDIMTMTNQTSTEKIVLLDPTWQTVHFMFFILFVIYAIYQALQLIWIQK